MSSVKKYLGRIFQINSNFLIVLGFFIIIQFLILPLFANAHSGGTYLRAQSGSSTIVVEYEGEKIIQNGFTRFNINLLLATTTDREIEIPHEAVWARIEQGNDILYAGWLYKPEGLQSGFSYTFRDPGEYVFTARFRNASGTLAEGAMNFSVESSGVSRKSFAIFFTGMTGGIMLLFLIIFVFKRLRKAR